MMVNGPGKVTNITHYPRRPDETVSLDQFLHEVSKIPYGHPVTLTDPTPTVLSVHVQVRGYRGQVTQEFRWENVDAD